MTEPRRRSLRQAGAVGFTCLVAAVLVPAATAAPAPDPPPLPAPDAQPTAPPASTRTAPRATSTPRTPQPTYVAPAPVVVTPAPSSAPAPVKPKPKAVVKPRSKPVPNTQRRSTQEVVTTAPHDRFRVPLARFVPTVEELDRALLAGAALTLVAVAVAGAVVLVAARRQFGEFVG
jgi:hypothetical protein